MREGGAKRGSSLGQMQGKRRKGTDRKSSMQLVWDGKESGRKDESAGRMAMGHNAVGRGEQSRGHSNGGPMTQSR